MLRALRAIPNSSGGTPWTRAQQLRLRTRIVTSCSWGAGSAGREVAPMAPRAGASPAAAGAGAWWDGSGASITRLILCAIFGAVFDHLDCGIRDNHGKLLVREIVVGLLALLFGFLPPHLHDAMI